VDVRGTGVDDDDEIPPYVEIHGDRHFLRSHILQMLEA
jgi:hypothetical protein